MNDYLKTKELYHHGIKGQKWGIRRYQNEDGTLTEAGKKKYGKIEDKIKKKVLLEERGIALANATNLQEGRKHFEDRYLTRSFRTANLANRKKVDKLLKKLEDSGYFNQIYGKKLTFDDYKQNVEMQAVDRYIKKYGKMKLSKHDPDGSEDYEKAIFQFTTDELKKTYHAPIYI